MTTNNPDSGNNPGFPEEEFLSVIRGQSTLRLHVIKKHLRRIAEGKKFQKARFIKELALADDVERKQNGEQA